MASRALARPLPARRPAGGLSVGIATGYLSLIVLLPLAAVVARSAEAGSGPYCRPDAASLRFSEANTNPGSTIAVRASGLISITRFR